MRIFRAARVRTRRCAVSGRFRCAGGWCAPC